LRELAVVTVQPAPDESRALGDCGAVVTRSVYPNRGLDPSAPIFRKATGGSGDRHPPQEGAGADFLRFSRAATISLTQQP
jgi:hypothetical protein